MTFHSSLILPLLGASSAAPPPFLLNMQTGGVDLKVVVLGPRPENIKSEVERLYSSFPNEAKTRMESISAPNAPGAGTSYFFQVVPVGIKPIQDREIRLHVLASAAPVSGPDSVIHLLTLKQAACVIILPGTEEEVRQLQALLKRPEIDLHSALLITVGSKNGSPKEWHASSASSVTEAVQQGTVELHRRLLAAHSVLARQ